MTTATTKFLQVGNIVNLDGKPRKIVSKQKAWKAPEYLITFEWYNGETITRSYYSNKKWDVM